jgi:5,10-methylenetetrahydrofolate reductase
LLLGGTWLLPHMRKLCSHKVSNIIALRGNKVVPWGQFTSLYKNNYEMIMIVKRFGTYVFFLGIIMSSRKKSLSCLREKLKPFFLKGTIMSSEKKSSFFPINMVAP